MLRAVLLIASTVAVVAALKCNQVTAGNLSVSDTSQASDCPLGSLTCLKVIDFSRNTYTKQCQTMNCTLNGQQNAAANCQNSTALGLNAMTCCCYGDGCNSAPTTGFTAVIGTTIASFVAFSLLG